MSKKMYADNSVVAIYEGDDSVISNPMGRLEDVYFHSDLSYMEVVQRETLFVTLPGGTGNTNDKIPVLTHGLGEIPLVNGFIKTLGIPLTGSVVLDIREEPGRIREIVLGADTTDVSVFQSIVRESATSYSSLQLEIEIFVYGVS